ncbi:uncharacterized protein [Aegilops tauschii subsp. strangulata]|uniref:uncharacterized protein n=1 Tax=Aegilops tauschii subsp. strangulata TaxID=200361 RepID=UPI003CC8B4A5
MNFAELATRELAQELAPPPRLVADEDRRVNRRRECHLGIAGMDVEGMTVWLQRFSKDVVNEREFYAQSRAERVTSREDRRPRKAAALFNIELKEASSWDSTMNGGWRLHYDAGVRGGHHRVGGG